MRVYQYGTEIGIVYHQVAYLGVSSILINQLAKHDIDLEGFMESEDIRYQVVKPQPTPNTCELGLKLPLYIEWDDWYCPNSGKINGYYFWYRYDYEHGKFIQLVYNQKPYFTFSKHTPAEVQPYFDHIWRELKETGYIEHPKKISLASKVANQLPKGFKAFKAKDESQCRVEKNKKNDCYITRLRDFVFYTSFSDNPTLSPCVKSNNLESAIDAVEKVLKMTEDCKNNPLSIYR